jgi:hypothetical protein
VTWTREPPTYAAWHASGGNGLSTRRITEAGSRRITEQGSIRIVARMSDAGNWTMMAPSPSDIWIRE